MRNDTEMLQLLIRFNAPLDHKDFKGRTPLSFVMKNVNETFNELNPSESFSVVPKKELTSIEKTRLRMRLETCYEMMSVRAD